MSSAERVLVTGATGFIGCRLVEFLMATNRTEVRALIREYSSAARLARFRVEMVHASLTQAAALAAAVKQCDVVYHCAYDFADPAANIAAASTVGVACVEHGVRRLVYVSSMSVYEPLPEGELDESVHVPECGWTYPDTKRSIEAVFERLARDEGLSVVTVQPTIVYGPFSKPWTLEPVRRLREGRVLLPDGGAGYCHAVYVDDVVSALLQAATAEGVDGARFLISGPSPVTWGRFYRAYEGILGVDRVVPLPVEEVRRLQLNTDSLDPHSVRRDPRRVLQWTPVRALANRARGWVHPRVWARLKRVVPQSLLIPSEQEVAHYTTRTSISTAAARERLGYRPAFSFEDGMDLTAQYIRWANL